MASRELRERAMRLQSEMIGGSVENAASAQGLSSTIDNFARGQITLTSVIGRVKQTDKPGITPR